MRKNKVRPILYILPSNSPILDCHCEALRLKQSALTDITVSLYELLTMTTRLIVGNDAPSLYRVQSQIGQLYCHPSILEPIGRAFLSGIHLTVGLKPIIR